MGSVVSSIFRSDECEQESGQDQVNALRKEFYIAPLLDDSCPILKLHPTVIEKIFVFLNSNEISVTSRTCKSLNKTTGEYLRHVCSTFTISLQRFEKDFPNLMTHHEIIQFQRIKSNVGLELRRPEMYKMYEELHTMKKIARRISFSNSEVEFAHRGDERYIVVETDLNLSREIVRVKSVCWLRVSLTLKDVNPGVYQVSFRVFLSSDFVWPHRSGEVTEVNLKWPGSQNSFQIEPWMWKCLHKNQSPAVKGSGLGIEWEIVNTHSTGWVMINFPCFDVRENGSVIFELQDIQCPWWKRGLYFDFLELRKL